MTESSWTKYLERKKVRDDKKKIRDDRKLQKHDEYKKKRQEEELKRQEEELKRQEEELKRRHEKELRKRRDNRNTKCVDSVKDVQSELPDLGHSRVRKHKGKYRRYSEALKSCGLLDEINELLDKRDFIIVKNADVAKRLGKQFVQRSSSTIYWALKYTLFYEGIICQLRSHIHDTGNTGTLLFMRKRKDEDCLAMSLQYTRPRKKKCRR
jgi:hypothetical protein